MNPWVELTLQNQPARKGCPRAYAKPILKQCGTLGIMAYQFASAANIRDSPLYRYRHWPDYVVVPLELTLENQLAREGCPGAYIHMAKHMLKQSGTLRIITERKISHFTKPLAPIVNYR